MADFKIYANPKERKPFFGAVNLLKLQYTKREWRAEHEREKRRGGKTIGSLYTRLLKSTRLLHGDSCKGARAGGTPAEKKKNKPGEIDFNEDDGYGATKKLSGCRKYVWNLNEGRRRRRKQNGYNMWQLPRQYAFFEYIRFWLNLEPAKGLLAIGKF